MVTAREIRNLLDERPDLEAALEAILEPEEPWAFHDVDVESGPFGEFVSCGIVERDGEGYRVADRTAVQRALQNDLPKQDSRFDRDLELPNVDTFSVGLLASALLVVIALRVLFSAPAVLRGEHFVLSGNDPYFYRYWVETMLADPEATLSAVPSGIERGEPFLVAALYLASSILGGTSSDAGLTLAWFPVVSAVVTAILVYVITSNVTDDRRIALAAVLLLAVLPGHAFRTSLGFADHHAFDYPWLALTLLGIVLVVVQSRQSRNEALRPLALVGAAAAITIGVAGQTLAWDASPLLLAPVGLFLAVEALRAVHANEPPIRTCGPILAGTAIAAAVVWHVHSSYGWHTEQVAIAPALIAIGGLAVLATAELVHRLDLPTPALAAAELLGLPIAAFLFSRLRPEDWVHLTTSIDQRLLNQRSIAEVDYLLGDSFGWLLLFGFILVLALPYMAWGTRHSLKDARWLPVAMYAWYFLVLATIQIRFVGELASSIAIFAGLGFVHLAAWIDVAKPPAPFNDGVAPALSIPDRKTLTSLVLLFLLVGGLSLVQVPVKTSQITITDAEYETATGIAEYSEAHDLEYPENYVLSFWDRSRLYNYFANGESRSYGYAQTNYEPFALSTDPGGWYDNHDDRVGFVVTTPVVVTNDTRLGTLLHRHDGNATDATPGLAHYRLIHSTEDGSHKAFALVDGAVIEDQTDPNATVTARTEVDLEGSSFTYVRRTETDATGNYTLRVAHPGEYEIDSQTLTLSESDVMNGSTVSLP